MKKINEILKQDKNISVVLEKEDLQGIFKYCINNNINIEFVDICPEYDSVYYVCVEDNELYIEPLFKYDRNKCIDYIPEIDVDKIYFISENKKIFLPIEKEFSFRNINVEYINLE